MTKKRKKQTPTTPRRITIEIEIPRCQIEVLSPRSWMGNYVLCDNQYQYLLADERRGVCSVLTSLETTDEPTVKFRVVATYDDPELALFTALKL